MKLKYTFILYLLLISFSSYSQPKLGKDNTAHKKARVTTSPHSSSKSKAVKESINPLAIAPSSALTGVWRGFFTSGMGFFQEKYRYEVQIGQLNNNGIKGVTYSYKTTVFYGKANLAGMYTPSTKNLVLKENKLIEVKMAGGEACLMTCYLEYSKVGGTQILEGTFTSVNLGTKEDCGSGRVYLEKVPESDFYKEEFVKEYEMLKKHPPVVAKSAPKITKKSQVKTPTPKVVVTDKRKPIEKDEIVKKDPLKVEVPENPRKIDEVVVRPIEEPKRNIPKVLIERENKIAKVIQGEGDEIVIELFDNGQIDNDTITVYHNKTPIAVKKRLCHQPITFRIKVDPNKTRNEFVMVAENLGTIPPNTALMVVTIGKQRHEVTITSTEQKNAVVIIDCKPLSSEGK